MNPNERLTRLLEEKLIVILIIVKYIHYQGLLMRNSGGIKVCISLNLINRPAL